MYVCDSIPIIGANITSGILFIISKICSIFIISIESGLIKIKYSILLLYSYIHFNKYLSALVLSRRRD